MKKIIYFVPIVAIALAALWVANRQQVDTPVNANSENGDDAPLIESPDLPGFTLPFENNPRSAAWDLFQKYLSYNKARDLEGLRGVVYKVAAVCNDPKTRLDCEARMANAYQYGSVMEERDFTELWQDEKQIILATDFWIEESQDMGQYGRFRSIIYFIKGADGEWKLLSWSPFKGVALSFGEASREEIVARALRYTEDNDEDGIADYSEECLDAKEAQTCTKTNTSLRDTNGDGWWDSVNALLLQNP